MWQYIVIIGLILGAGVWIVVPLVRPSSSKGLSGNQIDEKIRRLTANKENAYAVIKELEFDLGMGKLSKEDYESLKKQYMIEAIECLKEIETLQSQTPPRKDRIDQDIEKELEREILNLRRKKPGVRPASKFCSQCGSKASSADRFCVNCGAKLKNI